MLGYEKRKVAIDMLKHLTTLSLGDCPRTHQNCHFERSEKSYCIENTSVLDFSLWSKWHKDLFSDSLLGAIAVIASFLQKFLEFEKAKTLLSLSVGSFFICVIFSIIACLILLANIENLPEKHGSGMHNFLRVSFLLSISGFVIGTCSLAWLVVNNIA